MSFDGSASKSGTRRVSPEEPQEDPRPPRRAALGKLAPERRPPASRMGNGTAHLSIPVPEGFLFLHKCEVCVNYTIAMHTFSPESHRERTFPSEISLAKPVELSDVVYFKHYCKIQKLKKINLLQERLL